MLLPNQISRHTDTKIAKHTKPASKYQNKYSIARVKIGYLLHEIAFMHDGNGDNAAFMAVKNTY